MIMMMAIIIIIMIIIIIIIIIIIFFLLRIRPIFILDVPLLFCLSDYVRRQFSEFLITPFAVDVLLIVPCTVDVFSYGSDV